MALRFPSKNVCFDIVEGHLAHPVIVERDGWKVLRVTYEQMNDYHSCRQIMRTLAALLKSPAPTLPDWDEHTAQIHRAVLKRSA